MKEISVCDTKIYKMKTSYIVVRNFSHTTTAIGPMLYGRHRFGHIFGEVTVFYFCACYCVYIVRYGLDGQFLVLSTGHSGAEATAPATPLFECCKHRLYNTSLMSGR